MTASLLAFAACGGGGSSDDTADDSPDANVAPDANENNCVASTVGTADIYDSSLPDFVAWEAPLDADFGDGGDVIYRIEFYGSIEPDLATTFDLAAGNQNNYRTCAVCLRAFSLDADGALVRQFFQSAGSITVNTDPLTGGVLDASVTGLEMVEVTIADDYTSTPVDNGACTSAAQHDLAADLVPNAWTCDNAAFGDGTNCDCGCGAADPDCDIAAAPVVGCPSADYVCEQAVCTELCDVMTASGCTAGGTCGFETATQDVCYTDATLFDAATLGNACTVSTALFCAVDSTVAGGICDSFAVGDSVCREACDDPTDCTLPGDVCSAVVGTKGMCVTPPLNNTCGTALPIVIGTPVTGQTAGATGDYNAGLEGAACTGFAQTGPDVAYVVTLTAAQQITVTLTPSPNYDPAVALVGPGTATVCDGTITTCVAGADATLGGEVETFTYTAAAAGDYYLIVDGFGGATNDGSFTLSVTSP